MAKNKKGEDDQEKDLIKEERDRSVKKYAAERDFYVININQMFNAWHDAKGYRKNIHASDILKGDEIKYNRDNRFCFRECVLLNFYEQELKSHDIWTTRRFLNGWMLHEKWQDLMEKHGSVVAIEEEIANTEYGFKIVFTPDAIINFMGQKWIVEIKGYKSDTYNALDVNGPPPDDAHDQCNLYMNLTGIHRGFIIVENKDNSNFKVWAIDHSEMLAQPYLDKLNKLKVFVEKHKISGSLPKGICDKYKCERAERCNVRDACFHKSVREKTKLPAEEWMI